MRLSWTPQNGLGLLLREVDRNEPVLKTVHDEAVPSSYQVPRFRRFRLSYCMTSSYAQAQLLSFLISFLALSCAKQPRQTIAVLAGLVDVLWLEKMEFYDTGLPLWGNCPFEVSICKPEVKCDASFVYDLSWCMTRGWHHSRPTFLLPGLRASWLRSRPSSLQLAPVKVCYFTENGAGWHLTMCNHTSLCLIHAWYKFVKCLEMSRV